MASEVERCVRRLCLAFPEVQAHPPEGSCRFRVAGRRSFATYAEHVHGDGTVALWLNVPSDVQDAYICAEPEQFFRPPYLTARDCLGVRLDKVPWSRVMQLVHMAYMHTAPRRVAKTVSTPPRVSGPRKQVRAAEVDPLNSQCGKQILKTMRDICLSLPETSEGVQFGQPVWRVGKKVFARMFYRGGRWQVAFWVGVPLQLMFTADARYEIPAYIGPNGWIARDAAKPPSANELYSHLLESYRHFANNKVLKKLPKVVDRHR